MIGSNLGRAAILSVIPLLVYLGALRLSYLYLAVLLIGTLTVFFEVCYQSYLPSIVSADDLVEGNGKLQGSTSLAQVGGPALGGGLVQLLTAPVALLANAATYLVSVGTLLAIRTQEPAPAARRHVLREIGEGLRFSFSNRYLRACAAVRNLQPVLDGQGDRFPDLRRRDPALVAGPHRPGHGQWRRRLGARLDDRRRARGAVRPGRRGRRLDGPVLRTSRACGSRSRRPA
jgi:hypothetical protein